ncbi:MAG: protein translocase subunit SecDF [Bacteroidaceae bacterium]|nr:protein translocase subunit SecDF [Bacteroidaceae bacterium]
MQNKGFVKFLAVALTLICLFYLSFSFVTKYVEDKASEMEEQEAELYLDSLNTTPFYLGNYTLKDCRETAIGLGLDLKGGMNVILEVSVPEVVKALANHKTDEAFLKSVDEAAKEAQESQSDFITLFVQAYKKNAPGKPLAAIFATQQLKGQVNTNSSDADVEKVLRQRVDEAVDNSFLVLRTRIDRFGVVQPNIQKIEGQNGRIMVELPGIKEPERVRKLLQGSANLEFWETYDAPQVAPYLSQLNAALRNGGAAAKADTLKADTTAAAEPAAEATAEAKQDAAKTDSTKSAASVLAQMGKGDSNDKAAAAKATEEAKKENPLFAMLQPTGAQRGCMVGLAQALDTAEINALLHSETAKQIFPADLSLKWGVKSMDKAGKIFELYAIRTTGQNGRAPLEGEVVTEAKDEFDQYGNPVVTMKMNTEGARKWAALTEANVNHCVAVVLDNLVYSAPNVMNKIDGGSTQISGSFTTTETKDLANVLQSGKMPAPASIIQEDIVGPTLGAQSIQAGFISCIVAFIVLMLYMVLMYGVREGMVANCALMLNFFFSFGILTSLGAALTMSGIAGMVLTLGMAVDANVLIYERTKEEMRSGKNIAAAVAAGYSNAFSAIFDSNVTTILTGVILYNFGTGPIKGFATTLIIGIVCSFFTAVWLTRIAYEHFLDRGKWQDLKFTTKLSQNMMKDTKYNFMGNYKKSFIAFGIFLAVALVSFAIRGLSQSIDFTGGRNYKVEFVKQVEPEAVKEAIVKQFEANNPDGEAINVTVIALGTEGNNVRVSTNFNINDNSSEADAQIESLLYQAFVDGGMVDKTVSEEAFLDRDDRAGGSIVSSQKVGPAIASDILRGAILSVLFAIAVIFVYILIRFRNVAYSVGSIVALTLDTVLVIGMFSLCYGWIGFSLEVDQTFIGAILTVIGYSINDKVVIFDRIREVFKNYPKRDRQRIFNDALNSTLARTINTSVSTFIVLLVIFVLGGDSIRAFAFAMMLGVIIGTSSSLFIAAPTAYLVMGARIKEAEEEQE